MFEGNTLVDQVKIYEPEAFYSQEIQALVQKYSWNFWDVLDKSEEYIKKLFYASPRDYPDYPELLVEPMYMIPRIIRGVIDYKIVNDINTDDLPSIIDRVLSMTETFFSGAFIDLEYFDQIKGELLTEFPWIMNLPIIQQSDETTQKSADTCYTNTTIEEIKRCMQDSQNMFFIILWHGWTIPWLDLIIKLKQQMRKSDIDYYVVRCSLAKHGDVNPQLSGSEKEYLYQSTQRKDVIIFDEDQNSWRTEDIAADYFIDQLPDVSSMQFIDNMSHGSRIDQEEV